VAIYVGETMGGIFATILYCEVFINSSLKHNACTVIKLLLYSEIQMKALKIISKSSKLCMQRGQDIVSYSVTLIGTWFLSNNCSLLRKYCIAAIFYEGLFHTLKEYGFWDNINWYSSSPYFRSIFMLM